MTASNPGADVAVALRAKPRLGLSVVLYLGLTQWAAGQEALTYRVYGGPARDRARVALFKREVPPCGEILSLNGGRPPAKGDIELLPGGHVLSTVHQGIQSFSRFEASEGRTYRLAGAAGACEVLDGSNQERVDTLWEGRRVEIPRGVLAPEVALWTPDSKGNYMQVFFDPLITVVDQLGTRKQPLYPSRGLMLISDDGAQPPHGPMWWTFDLGFLVIQQGVGRVPGQHVTVVDKNQNHQGEFYVLEGGKGLLFAKRELWAVDLVDSMDVGRSLLTMPPAEAEKLSGQLKELAALLLANGVTRVNEARLHFATVDGVELVGVLACQTKKGKQDVLVGAIAVR